MSTPTVTRMRAEPRSAGTAVITSCAPRSASLPVLSMIGCARSTSSHGNPRAGEAALAELLIERIPSIEQVQFSCSSTESCMSAVRLARAFTGRTKIAKFEGGYHGFSDQLMVSSHSEPEHAVGSDSAASAVADSAGIPASDVDNVVLLPQNDLSATRRLLTESADDIACLISEFQSGSGRLVALDRDFVAALRQITSDLGILLIADETISLRAGHRRCTGPVRRHSRPHRHGEDDRRRPAPGCRGRTRRRHGSAV
ncbi:aminotransferase class III-fold pyridoxal phosphate-dependent enzyme [Microbacterium sp. bgisy207]|uniref:aminotransferase class III-fold pyridoxal phosphate-dependent enzyme n=1 Tax=Microbacterium sp. bgisy207 TaxID=3413800 RepID=UPI003EC0727F